jgi:hypothetical protein
MAGLFIGTHGIANGSLAANVVDDSTAAAGVSDTLIKKAVARFSRVGFKKADLFVSRLLNDGRITVGEAARIFEDAGYQQKADAIRDAFKLSHAASDILVIGTLGRYASRRRIGRSPAVRDHKLEFDRELGVGARRNRSGCDSTSRRRATA